VRLWTLPPKYLDARGLTAWWREALLAAINACLGSVAAEAQLRGYAFDRRWRGEQHPEPHPRFAIGPGEIEP
jgi:hypothetical protein